MRGIHQKVNLVFIIVNGGLLLAGDSGEVKEVPSRDMSELGGKEKKLGFEPLGWVIIIDWYERKFVTKGILFPERGATEGPSHEDLQSRR